MKKITLNIETLKTSQEYLDLNTVKAWKERITAGELVEIDAHFSEGDFYILDGNHRFNALKELGYNKINVNFYPAEEMAKYLFNV